MKPPRKPVNLFAKRCRMRPYANVLRMNAMYGGMDVTDAYRETDSTDLMKGTLQTDGPKETTDGDKGTGRIDERMEAPPNALAHSGDDSAGATDTPFTGAESSDTARSPQSVSLKPDGGAQGVAVPAVSSAPSGISFRLKDGSTILLPASGDESISPRTLATLTQLAERFELIPETRVTAKELPPVIRQWLHPARWAA